MAANLDKCFYCQTVIKKMIRIYSAPPNSILTNEILFMPCGHMLTSITSEPQKKESQTNHQDDLKKYDNKDKPELK